MGVGGGKGAGEVSFFLWRENLQLFLKLKKWNDVQNIGKKIFRGSFSHQFREESLKILQPTLWLYSELLVIFLGGSIYNENNNANNNGEIYKIATQTNKQNIVKVMKVQCYVVLVIFGFAARPIKYKTQSSKYVTSE